MSDKNTPSSDRRGVGRSRRSSRLKKLAVSAVPVIALVLGLINDTLGVKTILFGPSPPAASSRPDTSTIAKNLSIENRLDYQSTMGLEQEDDGTANPTTIRWNPTFLISNENTIPLPIVDIDVNFPDRRTQNGDVVLLKKKKAEGIIVYQDVGDYLEVKRIRDKLRRSNEEFSRTPGRVVIPAGGGERILEFKHLYSLEIGSQPVRFAGEKDFIYYLGQYLDLKPDSGDYRCGSKKLDVTIRTPNEAIAKQVGIFLTPVGCTLRIPGG